MREAKETPLTKDQVSRPWTKQVRKSDLAAIEAILPSSSSIYSSLLHVKLLCGWSVVMLLDLLVGVRLEYLYPAFMFVRSVLDSYRYQGLVSVRVF